MKLKIAQGLGIINKANTFLSKIFLTNYSFIYPYFAYCVEVWGNAATSHLLPLCLLQNKVVRIITYSNKRAQVDSLYLELNLLSLYKIVHKMYKYYHDMLPIALHDLNIKTISFTNIGPGIIIYCMFQAAHTLKYFFTPSVLIRNNLQSVGFEFNISF